MMYLFWFVEFMYNVVFVEPLRVVGSIFNGIITAVDSVITLVSVLPLWLTYPFYCLLSIAVVFRVSQFIPTLGGASNS